MEGLDKENNIMRRTMVLVDSGLVKEGCKVDKVWRTKERGIAGDKAIGMFFAEDMFVEDNAVQDGIDGQGSDSRTTPFINLLFLFHNHPPIHPAAL
jgi:hypothetical protein